jgi:F-type H+-transporting ATPase subunit gamma
LGKADFEFANELAQNVIDRYCDGQIDAVYLVFNEFKSVIA